MSNSISRNVKFYAVVNADNSNPFDPSVLKGIDKMIRSPEESCRRYLRHPGGEYRIIGSSSKARRHGLACFVLTKVRITALPPVESEIEKEAWLTQIPLEPHQGLAERTHIVWCSDRIVAVEHNIRGPWASRLPEYVQHALPDAPHFNLAPIPHKDVAAEMEKMKRVTVAKLRYVTSELLAREQADSDFQSALATTATEAGAYCVEITYRVKPYSRKTTLAGKVIEGLRGMVRKGRADPALDKAIIKGKGEDRDMKIDVLSMNHYTEVQFMPSPSYPRHIDSPSAFDAIWEAYNDRRNQLERSMAFLNERPRDE